MIKTLLGFLLALFAAAAFAAVDVNKATQADLESIKGIGPVIATKILDERKKSSFKDWQDMITRVKGVGENNAAKFSSDGLTVNGAAFAGAPAAPRKDAKTTAKAAPASTGAAPAMAPAAKADAAKKPEAAAPAAAKEPTAKEKAAADKAAEKAAKKEAKEKAAEDKAAAKSARKAAAASKTSASAPAAAASAKK